MEIINNLQDIVPNKELLEDIDEEFNNLNVDDLNLSEKLKNNAIDGYWIGFFNDHVYIWK